MTARQTLITDSAHVNGVDLAYVDREGIGRAVARPDSTTCGVTRSTPGRAGFRVIAPDLRGFGESSPQEIEAYEMRVLVSDIVGLTQHLGFSKAHRRARLGRGDRGCTRSSCLSGRPPRGVLGRLRGLLHAGIEQPGELVHALLPVPRNQRAVVARNGWQLFKESWEPRRLPALSAGAQAGGVDGGAELLPG